MKVNIGNITSGNNTNISINNNVPKIEEFKDEILKDNLSYEDQIKLKKLIDDLNTSVEDKDTKNINTKFSMIKNLSKEVAKAIAARLALIGLNLV